MSPQVGFPTRKAGEPPATSTSQSKMVTEHLNLSKTVKRVICAATVVYLCLTKQAIHKVLYMAEYRVFLSKRLQKNKH